MEEIQGRDRGQGLRDPSLKPWISLRRAQAEAKGIPIMHTITGLVGRHDHVMLTVRLWLLPTPDNV